MQNLANKIIKEHNLSLSTTALLDGYNEELEHTRGRFALRLTSREIFYIALAHLESDKDYYIKLRKYVEKK
jgi:hypothetical protein